MTLQRANMFIAILFVIGLLMGILIWKHTYIAQDGARYFTVDDDALISLRYAWNLAHGKGLVWNAGERVEGITNPLWTIYAALWATVTPRRFLPLVIQISGIACLLAQCWLSQRLAQRLWQHRQPVSRLWETIALLLPVAYYPLVYWSIGGLEVCAVGMSISLALLLFIEGRYYITALVLGTAFWLRPDSLLIGAWIFALAFLDVFKGRLSWRKWFGGVVILAGCVAVLFLLRQAYYGTTWPNTYTLKLRHFHLADRLRLNAWGYLQPFLRENLVVMVVALASITFRPSRLKFLLAGPAFFMTAYAAYTGGDALPYWRFMAPFIPLLALVVITELPACGQKFRVIWIAGCILAVGSWAWAAIPFYKGEFFKEGLSTEARHARANIETAIILNQILKPDATIGVFRAGSVPYYTDFRAIDFLGKSDPIIAHLSPDLDIPISWGGMLSVPGHNKHNLTYSIVKLKPTYIEGFAWGGEQVSEFVKENYVYVEVPFVTPFTDTYILLLRNSQQVDWTAVHRLDPSIK